MNSDNSRFTPNRILGLRLLPLRRVLSDRSRVSLDQKTWVERPTVFVAASLAQSAGEPGRPGTVAEVPSDVLDALNVLVRSGGSPDKLPDSATMLTDLAINAR